MNQVISLPTLLAVMAGGAVGTLLRYMVGLYAGRLAGTGFPWGTLFINISGSFLIGVLAELFALRWNAEPALRAFLVIGICGGYTTFSTFSLDTAVLAGRGEMAYAALYILSSVTLSIGALYLATWLIRQIA